MARIVWVTAHSVVCGTHNGLLFIDYTLDILNPTRFGRES